MNTMPHKTAQKLLQVLKDILPEFIALYEEFDPTGEIAVWDQWTEEARKVISEAEGFANTKHN